MGFVPSCDHDVFVSYAHVDDDPLPGTDQGWVTTLVRCVNRRLAELLGRRDTCSLWSDHGMSGHTPVSQQLLAAGRSSATLVVVLSPGYIASAWCARERNAFLSAVETRARSGVFIVEREPIDDHDRPLELRDLKGYRFWRQQWPERTVRILGFPQPSPADRDYHGQVDDLCRELASELKRQRALPMAASAAAALPGTLPRAVPESPACVARGPRVFLAETTDDLEFTRSGIRRYLSQLGIDVLPAAWYSQEPVTFRQSVERDLSQCDVFVQLISEAPGKKPPDLPGGYLRLQVEIAAALKKPILQWRRPGSDVSQIEDPDHRRLIDSETVREEGLEDFKREIRRQVTQPVHIAPAPLNAFVFVDMESADRPLAERVCGVLDTYGAEHSLPAQTDDPGEKRRDLEENLLTSDVLIVVYGNATATWVRSQLLAFRKIRPQRSTPLRALAVFEGPPEEKACIDLKLQDMHIVNCRSGNIEDQLRPFLDSVRRAQ